MKPGTQVSKFTGAATSDNVLHNKVITTGTNQDGQIITLVKAIPSFIGINHYAEWAESFCSMERKIEAVFMPTAPRKQDYGTVDDNGIFHWRPNTLDIEEDYNRDYKTWDKNLTAGMKQATSNGGITSIMASIFSSQSKVKWSHLFEIKPRMMLDSQQYKH